MIFFGKIRRIVGRVGAGLLILFLPLLFADISGSVTGQAQNEPLGREVFAADPFGFELTVRNFEKRYGNRLKKQRYFLESMVAGGQTDTIYRFRKGRTNILFYKPMKLEAKLMAANICKPEIALRNGIRVGITRKDFFDRFSDWPYDASDSLLLESPSTGCTFTFVFSGNKLKAIRIASAQQQKSEAAPSLL